MAAQVLATEQLPPTMRAVQLTGFGGIEKLVYREDVPTPQPKADEVLIKVGACGMNNTDINTRTRWYDRTVNSSLSEDMGLNGVGAASRADADTVASWNRDTVGFPLIQGAAIAGRVVSAGSAADTGLLGKRVLVDPQVRDRAMAERAQLSAYIGSERDGGFAEFVAVPAVNAYPIETDLSDAELSTFPTSYDTAEEMLERTRLGSSEILVVTGAAGGVGTALIQLGKIRKARVIAIAGSSKEDKVRALGADDFVARDAADIRAQVEALIGEQMVDVVADVVGGPMFGDLLKLLRRGGRYSTAGAIGGPIQPFDLRDLIYKDLEMYGITCPTPETFERIVAYVESGELRPLLDKAFPLADLGLAQSEFVKRTHVGKFAIEP